MKSFVAALTLFALAALALPSKPPSGLVIVSWNYPAADMADPNLSFTVYHSPSLSPVNWVALTNVPGTNLSALVTIVPGIHFFSVTASNEWGEGNFSAVASLGPLPRSDVTVSAKRGD